MSAHRACVLLATLAFVDPILGRFVFTPILPLMRADYGLSIVAAGWLAGANHLGYLAGALTAARIPLTERAALRAGMLVVTASFAPMALPLPVEAWFVVRFVAGVGAAWVFVHAAAWGLRHALAAGRPEWSGWLFVGAGLTLIVSGVICALWTLGGGHAAGAWLANGAILAVILVVVWSRAGDARVSGAAPSRGAPDGAPADGDPWRMVLAYGTAGFGYVTAATFLPVLAQAVLGTDSGYMWFWPMFGLAALASMLIVMRVGGRVDDTAAFRFCVALMALGNLAMAWLDAGWALLFGTVAVGGTFMAVTLLGLREVRRRVPDAATRAIGRMTIAWALGQCAGPVVSAYLAGGDGRFTAALALTGLALLAAAAIVPGARQHAAAPASAPDHRRGRA
jgi:predicted MFS family arabinose efflux permease